MAACKPASAPPCPFSGTAIEAPSAGCFAVSDQGLLVVENLSGKLSPPGGSALPGESAQCAAHRETWEETGLNLLPTEQLATFDTGFELFHCVDTGSAGSIYTPSPLEVRRAFYLQPASFEQADWRFSGQGEDLATLCRHTVPACARLLGDKTALQPANSPEQ